MESTFILKPEEFNADFVLLVKNLFKNSRQLEISITSSEDFGLLKKETPEQYIDRLEKAAKDLDAGINKVVVDENELDEMVLSKLK